MTIAAIPGAYEDDPRFIGHVPGVRGSAIGAGAKLASRGAYYFAKRLGRYIFKPGRPTYYKAVSRGLALSAIYPWLQSDDGFDDIIDPPIQGPQGGSTFQQGNRRRSFSRSNRRGYNRCKPRNCC